MAIEDSEKILADAAALAKAGADIIDVFANGDIDESVNTDSGQLMSLATLQRDYRKSLQKALNSSRMYPSTAAGLANTVDQEYFFVYSTSNDKEIYRVYKNNGGIAVDQNKVFLSGTDLVEALNQANQAADAATQAAASITTDLSNNTDPSKGSALIGYSGRTLTKKLSEYISVKDFGAKGDMVSDDTKAFRDAISYCRSNGCILHITSPEWTNGKRGYLLSGQLYFDGPISVDCDPMAIMQWTSALGNNPAILIDYGDVSYNLGYFRFPILNGPSSDSLSLSGTAIKVVNGDIIDCQVNYIHGWDVGYHGAAISSNSENNKFRWEVMDKVNTGLLLEAANEKYLDVSEYYGNTIGICKYGIRFKTSSGGVVADNRVEVQQVWSEIVNGSCVYSEGDHNNQRNTVKIAYARAESTANTPAAQGTFKSPFISGTKQFLSQDGFWGGSSNKFEISPVPTGSISGDPIRVKVNGYDNKIGFPNSTLKFGATALSSTQGEANFLGGVGSALIFESTIVNQAMPAAAAGTVSTFYIYHQALTGVFRRRVQVTPLNDYQGSFSVFAEDNSNNVNREIKLTIRYLVTTSASQTVSFHVTV